MHILVINFKAENTAEEYNKATAEIAPVFAEIEGLIIKHFLFNHEEKTYGGCYQFESKTALDAYMAGDLFKMIMENPDWSDHMEEVTKFMQKLLRSKNRLKLTRLNQKNTKKTSHRSVVGSK